MDHSHYHSNHLWKTPSKYIARKDLQSGISNKTIKSPLLPKL